METSQRIRLCGSRGGCERLVKSHRVQPYLITFLALAAIALIVIGSLLLSDVQGLGTISRSQAIAMVASGSSLLIAGAVLAVLTQCLGKKDKMLISKREAYRQKCIEQIEQLIGDDISHWHKINLDCFVDRFTSNISDKIASKACSELKQYFEEHYPVRLSHEFYLGRLYVFIWKR